MCVARGRIPPPPDPLLPAFIASSCMTPERPQTDTTLLENAPIQQLFQSNPMAGVLLLLLLLVVGAIKV